MFSRIFYLFLGYPHYIVYAGIVILMIFMGEEILLVIGALARLQILDFWAAFIIASLGTIAGDIFWYKLGARFGEQFVTRYGRWLFITKERFEKITGLVHRHGGFFIFVSKFIYNLNHVSEVAAGAVGFNFKKYIKAQIAVSTIWVFLFLSLGYFFANNLTALKHDVKLFAITLFFIFVGLLLLEKVVERVFEKRVLK